MTKKDIKKYAPHLVAISAAASCITLALLLICFFDAEAGYFVRGAASYILQAMLTLSHVSAAAFALLLVLSKSNSGTAIYIMKESDSPRAAESALPIITITISMLAITLSAIARGYDSVIPCAIGASALSLYLLLVSRKRLKASSIASLVLLAVSCALPIGIIEENSTNYFRHINSVENTLSAGVSILFLIYILYEARLASSGKIPRYHPAASSIMLSSALSLSVAYLVAYVLGAVSEEARALQLLILLFTCLSVLVRLVGSMTPVPPATAEQDTEGENE